MAAPSFLEEFKGYFVKGLVLSATVIVMSLAFIPKLGWASFGILAGLVVCVDVIGALLATAQNRSHRD